METLTYAALAILSLTVIGVWPARKFFEVLEAKSEMRAQSPSLLRTLRGWSIVAIWVVLTAYCGSFFGDWAKTGDLDGASERMMARGRIVIEAVAMIAASDK
ncbi:hypothetical protein ROG8370_00521 [Roseovarius gaetbuli]|uniref:Uncharacterized protein n=1 Tax=Roseovarius gaetbuli TaxID=1356575 RepID=A0A1X6YDX4_9RHOB|nr:hypothetical protein [Roseovarius gaetbuli]SLN17715.1 hypothetical protein ROG8370_00521 [Roseovarius gaetbuli]